MSYKKQTNCNKSTTLETFSRFSKKLLTSTLAQLVVLQQCAWAYNDIVPPQNVQDNPINHIVIDPHRADNVTFESLSAEAESRLDNMGAIVGNRQLVITTDQINNSAASVGYQTPVLRGGDVLVLDTGEGGAVNNRGGRIETTNADSILAINTGELNNITLTQAESQDRGNYKRVETHIGDTATISSAGDALIVTSGDLNMAGSKIGTVGDMAISVGGDLNTVSVQDYEYEYEKHSSGDMLSKKTKTDIKSSVKNIGSEISAGGDLGMNVGGNATFAGTTVNVGGNAEIDVEGNTNIVAVVDSEYEYHKTSKSSWGGLKKEKDITEDSSQHLAGANVNVVDGLTLNTGNNLNILASDVNVGGNADIDAGNNINIIAGDEVSTHYELHEKTNYLSGALNLLGTAALGGVTGGLGLLAAADSADVDCSGGHCSASMTIGKQTRDETYTETHTAIGSAINVGGDLSMDAKNDINIVGSDIAAGGSGSVAAGNNINILEAQNTQHTSSSHEDTKISVSATAGNAYVDAGYAAADAVKAADAVVKATEDLHRIQELHKQGKASSEAVRDAEIALGMATANAVNAELGLVSSAAGAASAAGTSFGTGMYGSIGANFETTKSTNSSDTKQSVASNLFGENMSFTSGNNMTQVGANVSATDTVSYDIGNDLNVLASTDTFRTESGSQTITAGGSIGNNAVQVNAGYSESSNRASSTTHNNSNITAENITVKTGNDATFAGANVTADDKLAMNIGGNLNVESKQDTDYAKGNNWGVNAGVGNTGSASGGFNVGSSNHDSAWVNDVTELRGGDVDINVGGKTTVTGAVIAAGEDGDLNLATNELEYKDLHDFNTSNERGFGVNTGIGISTDKGETNLHPQGSTAISATHTGSNTEQTTHATIGAGNITVGGDTNPELAGLNRDTDKVQEITKDEITGSLDSNVTVDNRVFSESGRKEISDQHEHFTDNVVMAGAGAIGTVEGAAKFVGDAVGLGEKEYDKYGNEVETNAIDKWKANQSGMATGIRRGGTEYAQKIIKDMSEGFVSPEDLQKLAAMTADGSVNLVYSNNQENVVFLDKDGNILGAVARNGFNDLTNKQGYVNLANGAGTDAYTFLHTDAEERAHNYVGSSETAASAAANNEMSYYNTVAGLTGGYTVAPGQYGAGLGTNAQSQYNQQYNGQTNTLLQGNSISANNVTGPTTDSRTVLGAIGGASAGAAVGSAIPIVGTAAGAVIGGLGFGGLGAVSDINEYKQAGITWENMPEEMRANYSSKEDFQRRGVLTIGLSTLGNESDMLQNATPVASDTPVYNFWTGEELPMTGINYQVGNNQYYTADGLAAAKDANYNSQAWAWTEIGLSVAPAVVGATSKISYALRYQPLYRAVEPAEYADILKNAKFNPSPYGSEGKYFSTTIKGVKQEGSVYLPKMSGLPASEYKYIKTSFPKSKLNDTMKLPYTDGGVPGYVIPNESLDLLTPPKVLKK